MFWLVFLVEQAWKLDLVLGQALNLLCSLGAVKQPSQLVWLAGQEAESGKTAHQIPRSDRVTSWALQMRRVTDLALFKGCRAVSRVLWPGFLGGGVELCSAVSGPRNSPPCLGKYSKEGIQASQAHCLGSCLRQNCT